MNLWLPTLPATQIDDAVVEEFLRAGHPESNTHEYKRQAETKRLPEVISALANSYGGVVIIGVPDDWQGDLSTLEDVDPTQDDRIVDRLVDLLDPSYWLRTLIPVIVDAHRLLVIHVDANEAPRPLLVNGQAFVEREKRKAPASWLELRSLYGEELPRAPAVPSLSARQLTTTGEPSALPAGVRQPPDCTWRVAAGCAAWPHEMRGRYADAYLRDQVKADLGSTALDAWLRHFGDEYQLDTDEDWHEAGPSWARVASFELNSHRRQTASPGPRASIHVQVDLAAVPHGPSGGGIAGTVDLRIWSTALAEDRSIAATGAVEAGRLEGYLPKLDFSGVGSLLEALVDTSEQVVAAAQSAVLHPPTPAFVGPVVWVRGPLDSLWDLSDACSRRPAANPLGGYQGSTRRSPSLRMPPSGRWSSTGGYESCF